MPVRQSVADITWDDYARQVSAKNGDFAALSAVAAGEFVCQLYKVNPKAVNNAAELAGTNPDARTFLLDKLCRPHNLLPDAPAQQYQGGQCNHVGYEVRVNYKEAYNFNEQILERTQQATDLFWGEIYSINPGGGQICINGPLAVKGFGWIDVESNGEYNGQFLPRRKSRLAVKSDNSACIESVVSVQVTRLGGQLDNCGNPAPTYPVKTSPVTNYNNTVNITNNANVNLTVPISIIPTLIAPIGVVVKPELNVNVGGLNIKFGTDGVRYENKDPIAPGPDISFDPRINAPVSIDNSYNDFSGGSSVDLNPVLTKIKEVKDELDECCDRNHPFNALPPDRITSTVIGSGNSGIVALPPNTFRVVLTITSNLSKMRVESGDDSPSVYYAGWAWFESDGGVGDRQPIDSHIKSYEPTTRANPKFAYKLRSDYTCSITAYSSKK